VERELIRGTIEFTAGNKTLAAQMLGVGVRTLYRRLAGYASADVAGRRNGDEIVRRNGSGM
jgi:DNA-binding NtrC family response regulator